MCVYLARVCSLENCIAIYSTKYIDLSDLSDCSGDLSVLKRTACFLTTTRAKGIDNWLGLLLKLTKDRY